jgi:hypothetical protein
MEEDQLVVDPGEEELRLEAAGGRVLVRDHVGVVSGGKPREVVL